MYRLIGADGHEYGPVSFDVLRQWIAEGRANGETKIRVEGGGEWRPLGEFAEFTDALRARYGTPPPTVPLPPPIVEIPASATPPQALPPPPSPAPLRTPPAASREAALAQLRPPAIMLLVVAGFGLFFQLIELMNLTAIQTVPLSRLPPEFRDFQQIKGFWFLFSLPGIFLGLALHGLTIFGGISMLTLKRWGFCLAGAIAMMLPCSGCCCCLGIAAGIWSLVVLNRADVRAAFTE